MSERTDQDEIAFHRGAGLFGALTANAFASLSFRLLRRLAGDPGFADEFAAMADEIIDELRSTMPSGYSAEQDGELHRQAIGEVREQFDEWLRQLRQAREA